MIIIAQGINPWAINKRRRKIMKKISWKVTFVRGDAPEYGELSIMVFAASEELAKEHIISCYGPETIIKEVK